MSDRLKSAKLSLSPEDQKIVNESLTIKDFLVVGDENLNKKIQNIEKNINIKSIKYLKINEISDYIKNKNSDDSVKEDDHITFFYYLIITIDDFQKNFEKIVLLSAELSLTFIVLIYIENEKDTLFNKNLFNKYFFVNIILVYSTEDIRSYLGKKINFNLLEKYKDIMEQDQEFIEFLKIPIPKMNFNNDNEDYQNGCFELAETFDINLVKSKVYKKGDCIFDFGPIKYSLYLLYKDNDALDLYYKYNIKYLGFRLEPDIIYLEISALKRILYMYCREETEYKKSLYYMLNSDLRSRDPAKIYRYIDLIAIINKCIDNGELANYKGKVYRATKLDENLILKLKEGSTMVNTTFWSTSKDYNVANDFLRDHSWRNSFIICEAKKSNIDIDFENLNYFAEKEILYLPFTAFKVEKVRSEMKFNKKIYIIELTELDSKNVVNLQNMQAINMDANYIENSFKFFDKKDKDKDKEKEIKNVKESENIIKDNEINESKNLENKNRKKEVKNEINDMENKNINHEGKKEAKEKDKGVNEKEKEKEKERKKIDKELSNEKDEEKKERKK